MRIQVHLIPYSSFRWYKNSLVFNRVISITPAKPAKSASPGTVCRSQHLSLKLSCLRESKRTTNGPTNSLKRRRHFRESSQQFQRSVKRPFDTRWWLSHFFDCFMSTFCWLFSMNCNWRTKMRTWVVFFYELWVSCSTRKNNWKMFVVETFM